MSLTSVITPAEVDFWLDSDKYANYFEQATNPSTSTLVFNIDMVRLSSIRKAVSNFVRILTRQNIPVYFNDANANVNFDGKLIHISAQINSKRDFDVAVGQALHEGAHSIKTDFEIVKLAWANVPHSIWKLSDAKNIRRTVMEKFIHTTWNVIEDRFIDNFVFNHAPGYRGYYVALYDHFWHTPEIDSYLVSDYCRYPSLDSYQFRITNLTNENTDLTALPRLEDIAKVIDISTIDRLKTTKDRINTTFEVVEIVLDCIDKQEKTKVIRVNIPSSGGSGQPNKQKGKFADPSDYFDFGEEEQTGGEEEGKKKGEEEGKEDEVDVGKKMIQEMSDAMSGKDPHPEEPKDNKDAISKVSNDENVETEVEKDIKRLSNKQRDFLMGDLPKEKLTNDQKSLLDLIEKHGIVLVRVDLPQILPGDDKNLKIDCIVVQKMTKELILSGQDVFPLSAVMKMGTDEPDPPPATKEAVRRGIQLGTKLGRKLQIRAEVNPFKIVRKKSGKINRRQLHEAASDVEELFYKIHVEEHNDANMHITVDASGSMSGDKWLRTMIAVVAICKAASMIDNIHITVSFRSTQDSGSTNLPYIVLAYDSKVDKFSKVKQLFPYLTPNGYTPEGLAFGAIMNLFENITPDEEDRYFLNLSDGQPYYTLQSPNGVYVSYVDEVGTTHTKSQVDKIRRHGVDVLSYFIEEDYYRYVDSEKMTDEEREEIKKQKENSPERKNFRKMYGKNAQFIDVESIVDLARTINGLFLTRYGEKNLDIL